MITNICFDMNPKDIGAGGIYILSVYYLKRLPLNAFVLLSKFELIRLQLHIF